MTPRHRPPDSEIVRNRRQNLTELIANRYEGRQVSLIVDVHSRTGVELNQGELSGLLGSKSFGEKKARSLEQLLDLDVGALDLAVTSFSSSLDAEIEETDLAKGDGIPTGRSGTGTGTAAKVAGWIVRAREDAKLTRQALAQALDVPAEHVGRWENGEAEPPFSVVLEISKLCSADLASFFERQPGTVSRVGIGLGWPFSTPQELFNQLPDGAKHHIDIVMNALVTDWQNGQERHLKNSRRSKRT
jgi:transcriptional regulator with XRE-family HTH domain